MKAGNPNFVKGHKRQGGRSKGTPNKATKEVREGYELLLTNNINNLDIWLKKVAQRDPAKALTLYLSISEFCIPKMQRTIIEEKVENKKTIITLDI